MSLRPLVKWAGGKRRIAHMIFEHFPANWNQGTYFEPFLGGGAVFLYCQPTKGILNDMNADLIHFYQNVKDNCDRLYQMIVEIAFEFNSQENKVAYYQFLREELNSSEPSCRNSAVFFALNKLCFNGLYRENLKGEFNVPFGNKKQFPNINLEHFKSFSERLVNASLMSGDFEHIVRTAVSGDFIYLDPPYIPLESTPSFTSYTSEGFTIDDHLRLSTIASDLSTRGVNVLISNSDTPISREIYAKLNLCTLLAPRLGSALPKGRGAISELLIMNYEFRPK